MPGARGDLGLAARRRFRGDLGATPCPPKICTLSFVRVRRCSELQLRVRSAVGSLRACGALEASPGSRFQQLREGMECLKSGHPMPALFPREPCPVCACAMAHAGKDQARGAEMATLAGNSICIAIWEEIYGLIHVAAPGRGAAGAKISSRGPLPDAATWISPSIASRALTIDNTNRNSRV